ncbi:FAU ubiquitin-like and ribosomal protein S30 [Hydractinia symbiolongicarpus]|uniref:FAU ubiquitin-like and ribosomal protein S30 n=1 Tax=Hydractinia symbiolongicarpus TaxID=13093 RepID=UPI00254DAA48|nr:FAU ubiquitin-like and ribosomal protein S30 [Hydractinia symbiolongicarpus]
MIICYDCNISVNRVVQNRAVLKSFISWCNAGQIFRSCRARVFIKLWQKRLYPPSKEVIMQIFVQGQSTNVYDISSSISVSDLKELIAFRSGVPVEDQVLVYGGHPLQDEKSLCECEINASSTISLGVRVLGGKVHGSLARAGKVKGQTPKVDKQEKKKPKTGRCKRRHQYNSRFANAVITPGRRRGPNSNA